MEINTLSCLLLFNLNLFANETTYSNTQISLTTIIAERTFLSEKLSLCFLFCCCLNLKREIDEHLLNCFCQFSCFFVVIFAQKENSIFLILLLFSFVEIVRAFDLIESYIIEPTSQFCVKMKDAFLDIYIFY